MSQEVGRIGAFLRLRVRGRLIAGFAGVCLVFAGAVGTTVWAVNQVSTATERMVDLRTPVAITSTELVGNLYSTLASLRGYLLTGSEQFKASRAEMWVELDRSTAQFDELAKGFTNSQNKDDWARVKGILTDFRAAQEKAEAVAFTPDALPATKLLTTEAAPRAEKIGAAITAMIDDEMSQSAMPERKQLLKDMADFRGNFSMATAGIRAFLLNPNADAKAAYEQRLANAKTAMARIAAEADLLSELQSSNWQTIATLYPEFEPLPAKMVAIRESDGWNVPVKVLTAEAAPLAVQMLDLLAGPKGADGTRAGGLKTRQQTLLAEDAAFTAGRIDMLTMMQWILLGVGLALSAIIALLLGRSIATPISKMTGAMQVLAKGDTTVAIPGAERSDEVGEMAQAVQVFKDSMLETERLRAEQEELKQRAEAEKRAAMNKLADDFQAAVGAIVETVSSSSTELNATSTAMAGTAEETTRQATAVAAASEQASTNVQTVAAATEEMTASVDEIGRQVSESTQIAGQAVTEAEATNAAVRGLAEAAQKIDNVVQIINDIAAQTNLLALNATIEAARAGDAGKGFAVVASEVKALANQTARATEEIAAQIQAMQTATADSVGRIEGIGRTIGRVSEIATIISSAVEEQMAATREIARNVQEAAQGTDEVSSNISGVSQAATETGTAAAQVQAASGELAKQGVALKQEVDQFLDRVRAA